jgi:uncharacterized repeat protein (TIGR02543 family)
MASLANLTVGEDAIFSENSASTAFPHRNPVDDAVYEQNIKGTNWTYPFTQGYNGFDIGYQSNVTVTFDGNGGNVSTSSIRIDYAASLGISMPPDPVREDHEFLHWNTQQDGEGDVFTDMTVVMDNITVFAQWQPITQVVPDVYVTVAFDGNGGIVLPENQNRHVVVGNPIGSNMPTAAPVRDGYSFESWSISPDGTGASFTDATAVYEDMVVYAQWVQIQSPPPPPAIPDPTPDPPPEQPATPEPSEPPEQPSEPSPEPPASPEDYEEPETAPFAEGRVQVIVLSEGLFDPLPGSVFRVYRASDDFMIAELTTDINGQAAYTLATGEYYLLQTKAAYGYLPESDIIYFTVEDGETVVVEVINSRDPDIPYAKDDDIIVPQTGEEPPFLYYVLGMFMLTVAMFCGILLICRRKPVRKN